MKRIERIRSWYNREYTVIETRRKRMNRFIAGWFYFLGIIGIYYITDVLALWSPVVKIIVWAAEPFADMYIGTWLEIPFIICIIIELIIVILITFIPGLYWIASADIPLDKEFLDDPERTERWRIKWKKKSSK